MSQVGEKVEEKVEEKPVIEGTAAEVKIEEKVEEKPEGKVEETPAPKAEEKVEPKPDWRDQRIAQLTARLKQQAPAPAAAAPADGETKYTQAEVDRLATEKAEALSAQAAFNAQCNATAAEGRKVFPDFDASVKELAKLVDPNSLAERQRYDAFLEAALETGEAHKIIYTLGRDLNEAERILNLTPIKRAQELVALAAKDSTQISNLPKPITPTAGKQSGPQEIDPTDAARADKLSSAEWHKRRDAQRAAAAAPYARRQNNAR